MLVLVLVLVLHSPTTSTSTRNQQGETSIPPIISPSLPAIHGPKRDGVSGVFVVSVGQGGLRRLAAHLTVISVWKTVVSETVLSGDRDEKLVAMASKTSSPKTVASAVCLGL